MQRVTFKSHGINLVGNLYEPSGVTGRLPAVALLGPMTFVKEQAPTEYARRLAEAGFIALVFDPRFRGESGGEPRNLESPMAKVEDLRAAVDFLASRPNVDTKRIHLLGICQGSSEAVRAGADDPRVASLATVAGHYRDRIGDVEWLTEEGLERHLAAGRAAREKYQRTGIVDYVPAVDDVRMDVGMPGKFVWDWYHGWADRGIWENQYAVMSDADLLEYESASAMQRLSKPYLMIHSDNSFLPNTARRQFEMVKSAQKRLDWDGQTPHLSYYDQAPIIDSATARVVTWFENNHG